MHQSVSHAALASLLLLSSALTTYAQSSRINRGTGPAPAPGTLFLVPERVATRDGRLVEAERGLMFVPMLRSDPLRGVLGVEVWRFRALTPTNAPPVFRLPGGPGHDGLHVNLADEGYYERQILPTIGFADFIVVGQRGIYTSPPNTLCERAMGVEHARRCRQYWLDAGLDPKGFTVVEAAHDVADIARALGYDSIVVRGGSFGSHWALALMRLHPDLVARVLLSGTEGPDHTYDDPAHRYAALRRIAASAESSPQVAELLPKGGLLAALDSIAARLSRAPVTVEVRDSTSAPSQTIIFGADMIPSFAFGYTGSANTRSGVGRWPAEILRVFYGDFTPAARRLAARVQGSTQPRWPFSYNVGAAEMLDCASGGTPARIRRIGTDSLHRIVGDGGVSWEVEMCREWNVDLGDDFRRDVVSNIPTVIVHGTWDLSTPYENALEILPNLRRGRLVTVEGGTHSALAEAQAADTAFARALADFLRTGSTARLPDRVVLSPVRWEIPSDLPSLARSHNRLAWPRGSRR
ncbi:MAG: alpha/beta hydrolase [Gemmatimonadales bacterium]